MAAFQRLFKQTFIYGLATVLPRMLSFLLVPLYTKVLPTAEYGVISIVFGYFIIFNVILAYGMETAFFRFYKTSTEADEKENNRVLSTAGWSLVFSSIGFFVLAFLGKNYISQFTGIPDDIVSLMIWIFFLDALVIIPFAWLRAKEKPQRYAIIKIGNVAINLGLNLVFLLYLGNWAQESGFFQQFYIPDFEINYVFLANLVASAATLLVMLPFYAKIKFSFDRVLWKKMLRYTFPVLIASLAFSINISLDKILLGFLLPENIAESQVGIYAACYKLAIFMTLFATAFRLGIEPFFFKHASAENAKETYAVITHYFVVFGTVILLAVIVFADLLKKLIISDQAYWEAMNIVPLILLANLCLGIYYNLSVWYKVTDRTRFAAYISSIGAVITIVLNLLLIPVWGYFGSAVALLAAYATMVLLSFYYGKKHYPIPYDLKKIMGYLGLSIGFSILSFYVFRGNYYVGISLLILFLAILYFSEKKAFNLILKNKKP